MVSLYNRLGGHVMHWSQLQDQLWGGATLPMIHEGKFYNSEIKVLLNGHIHRNENILDMCDESRAFACGLLTLTLQQYYK